MFGLSKTLLPVALVLSVMAVPVAAQITGPLDVEDRSIDRRTGGAASTNPAPLSSDQQGVHLLLEQIQQMEQQMQRMQGEIEQLRHQLEQGRAAERARYLDLDARINALQQQGGEQVSDAATVNRIPGQSKQPSPEGSESASTPAPSSAPSTEPAPVAPTGNDREVYRQAREHLQQGEMKLAADGFNRYLQAFPDGQFRPFAHFWLGEILRREGETGIDKAMAHFQTVVDDYPDHSQVPLALYKLASLQAEKGNLDRARVTLNRIILQFADSSEARLARSMLDQL